MDSNCSLSSKKSHMNKDRIRTALTKYILRNTAERTYIHYFRLLRSYFSTNEEVTYIHGFFSFRNNFLKITSFPNPVTLTIFIHLLSNFNETITVMEQITQVHLKQASQVSH